MLYGLIGYPLSHSWSARYFNKKFDLLGLTHTEYRLFPIEDIQKFEFFSEEYPRLVGLNVTIPYKTAILPYLSTLSEAAKAIGAVNCLKRTEKGWKGYNTDVDGFEQSLLPLVPEGENHALIFGTGGASRAVQYVLKKRNIPFQLVSRKEGPGVWNYRQLRDISDKDFTIWINTTPVGMAPDEEKYLALPFEKLTPRHLVYDLVYNPEETVLLKKARGKGATIKNGLEMLHLQAERSWEIWTK